MEFEQIDMFGDEPIKSTDWKWKFEDYPTEKNDLKVFSCFACGGGSTMGYKLAGCEVVGDLEIDKRVNDIYVENHHPKYNYLMDIREFNKLGDLPEELFNLDILDGSPPCTTFSMLGQREKTWGVEKKFREGQAAQTLDDLSFIFLDTVAKLKPKTVIMENVEGLTLGNAWKYVQKIYEKFWEIGYHVMHWLLKGENMGIPQTRHRVFFVGVRNDIPFDIEKVNMTFNYSPVLFGEVREENGEEVTGKDTIRLLNAATEQDRCLADVKERLGEKCSRFNEYIVWDNFIAPTIHAHGLYRGCDKKRLTPLDFLHCQTFPEDYKCPKTQVAYVCGMSVPPIMIKRIVNKLIQEGLYVDEAKKNDHAR